MFENQNRQTRSKLSRKAGLNEAALLRTKAVVPDRQNRLVVVIDKMHLWLLIGFKSRYLSKKPALRE